MSGTSVPSWEVIPITKTLQNANEKVIVETDMTSSTGKAMSNITNNMNQSNENSKYDTVNAGEIKALNGGKKNEKRVSIKYKNEKKVYKVENEDEAIREYMKEKNIKNDRMVVVYGGSKKNGDMYHLKSGQGMSYRKLYE